MADFNIRSDSVDVEQIMEQIRARIREKRGVDYTEDQIRELAAVKLEKFLDPRGVRSDLLGQFRRTPPPPERPNYVFGEDTLFETHRGPIRLIRRLLQPLLKLFFNPNPLIQALHIQSQLNALNAERETARYALDQLHYELMHNLVVETTRLGIEAKNLNMRVESLASRLEFNERRARALESVVVYKSGDQPAESAPAAETSVATFPSTSTAPAPPATGAGHGATPEGPGQRSRRRRRRRGRRGGGSAAAIIGTSTGSRPTVQQPERSSAGSTPVTTVEQALQPEARPREPQVEGSPEHPPAPSSGSGPNEDLNSK